MTLHVDAELPLPEAPGTPDRIGEVGGTLVLHGRAGAHELLVEGSRVSLTGRERAEPISVTVSGRVCASEIQADIGAAANVVASPGLVRREHPGPRGSAIQTLLAAPTLPLVALQWVGGGQAAPVNEVWFTLVPDATSARYRAGSDGVTALDDAHPNEIVVAVLHPTPSRWHVEEAPSGGARVRALVKADGPVTLLVAAGSEDRLSAALAAGANLAAHERAAQAAAGDPGLEIASGIADIDDAVGWARARLRGSLSHPPSDIEDPTRAFWSALGALAAGESGTALACLSVLERSGPPGEGAPTEPRAFGGLVLPTGPLAPFVAARIALTLGDATPSRSQARALTPVRLEELRTTSDEPTWALWTLTLELLADALRFGDSEAEIQRLREAAALPCARASRRVRLPVVGAAAPSGGDGPARLLRLLLRHDPAPALPHPLAAGSSDPADLLEAWRALAAGDIDRGWNRWRSALGSGLSGGSGPRGSWDGPEGAHLVGAPGAASLLGGLVHGLLGLAPDAPAGRVGLSPTFPWHLKSFEASNLAVGECRFRLSYCKGASSVRFEVEPTRGRVPPSLILSPTVAATAVGAARVDGAPADLDVRPAGSGVRVQVQLPLDGPRSLEIQMS